MNFDEYQTEAVKTALYTHPYYPYASVVIEAAELADTVAKPMLRGDNKPIDGQQILAEAGDVLWNLAAILHDNGLSLEAAARYNISKLRKRASEGTIMGDGDNR